MKASNSLKEKSYQFTIELVELTKMLHQDEEEFVLSNHMLESGTAIDAFIRKAGKNQSEKHFDHNIKIAINKARDTKYWLNLLFDTEYIDRYMLDDLVKQCNELISALSSALNTSRIPLEV